MSSSKRSVISSDQCRRASQSLIDEALAALDPCEYLKSLGFQPYEWQQDALARRGNRDRLLLVAARQSGKSTIFAGKTQKTAKFQQNALSLIVCPAKDQSAEVMQKVSANIALDDQLQATLVRDGVTLKEFANGSRIAALPGTERSVRGYSNPAVIGLDEASRILDDTYMAIRPMMSRADNTADIVAMTTPFGKRGWFYRAWANERSSWRKIMVRIPWDVKNDRLVPAMPEDEYRDYWKERGVSAYYSTAHDKRQLEDDLQELDPVTFRQEYCCEFLDEGGGLFSYDDILAAFEYDQYDAVRMLRGDAEEADRDDEYAEPLEVI